MFDRDKAFRSIGVGVSVCVAFITWSAVAFFIVHSLFNAEFAAMAETSVYFACGMSCKESIDWILKRGKK